MSESSEVLSVDCLSGVFHHVLINANQGRLVVVMFASIGVELRG